MWAANGWNFNFGETVPLMCLFLFSFPSCTSSSSRLLYSIYLLCRNSKLELPWPECISVGSWELFGEARWTHQQTTHYVIPGMQKQHVYKSQRSRYRHVCWWLCVFWDFPRWAWFATGCSSAPHTPVSHQLITSSIRSLAPPGFLHLVALCFCGCVLVVVFFWWLLRFLLTCAPLAFCNLSYLGSSSSVASSTTFTSELPPSPPPSTAIPHSIHSFVFTYSLSLLSASESKKQPLNTTSTAA